MELNQITLPVRDMQAAVDFYLTLGFRQIVDTPHYARFACPVGDATFSLARQDQDFSNGAVIYFEHPDLDTLVEELKSKGIAIEQPPVAQRYLWTEAIIRDPSGNKIKLYWAGENRLSPPWKVDKTA